MIVFVYGNGGIDTSDLNPDELGILSFLKRFVPGSANENLKIFAKILTRHPAKVEVKNASKFSIHAV